MNCSACGWEGAHSSFTGMPGEEVCSTCSGARVAATLREFMGADTFTATEKKFVHETVLDSRAAGGFWRSQWEALFRADGENFERLRLAFPEEAACVVSWRGGDLAQRVRAWRSSTGGSFVI